MTRHLHILGIGGTFMAGLALIAREAGYRVSGQDHALYPPMSDVLAGADIALTEGYEPLPTALTADCVVIGNALSRGNPAVEAVLNAGVDYASGAEWLARHILRDRWVIAVAGTHGKTTTASLIAWLLESAGLAPGFLIGGLPGNFGIPARLGESPFFVIEADEYDTAFFDKRSKFVHFRPRTLVLNNLEFDHGDIFDDLAAIERQFHHLVRTVPGHGALIVNANDHALQRVLDAGCWSERIGFGDPDQPTAGKIDWPLDHWDFTPPLPGRHNAMNTLAALLAARHVGVPPTSAIDALTRFRGVRRRLELRGEAAGVRVLDDFAHHPTAIAATLKALREDAGDGEAGRIIAVLEPRSNTMRQGLHGDRLASSLEAADAVFALAEPTLGWCLDDALAPLGERVTTAPTVADLIPRITAACAPGDTVVIMSNGAFDGIHARLLTALETGDPSP